MTFQTLTYQGVLTCADSVEMGDHNLDRSQPGSEDLPIAAGTRGNFVSERNRQTVTFRESISADKPCRREFRCCS